MKFFVLSLKRIILTLALALPCSYLFLNNTLLGDTVQCNGAREFGQYCVFVESSSAVPLRSLVVIIIFIFSYIIACVATTLVKKDKKKKKTG